MIEPYSGRRSIGCLPLNQIKISIMKRTILSAFGAFISLLCVVVTLTAFAKSGEGLFALLALFFGFLSVVAIGYGLDGSDFAEALSNIFAEEEVNHE